MTRIKLNTKKVDVGQVIPHTNEERVAIVLFALDHEKQVDEHAECFPSSDPSGLPGPINDGREQGSYRERAKRAILADWARSEAKIKDKYRFKAAKFISAYNGIFGAESDRSTVVGTFVNGERVRMNMNAIYGKMGQPIVGTEGMGNRDLHCERCKVFIGNSSSSIPESVRCPWCGWSTRIESYDKRSAYPPELHEREKERLRAANNAMGDALKCGNCGKMNCTLVDHPLRTWDRAWHEQKKGAFGSATCPNCGKATCKSYSCRTA